jgi:hypothetical protein
MTQDIKNQLPRGMVMRLPASLEWMDRSFLYFTQPSKHLLKKFNHSFNWIK